VPNASFWPPPLTDDQRPFAWLPPPPLTDAPNCPLAAGFVLPTTYDRRALRAEHVPLAGYESAVARVPVSVSDHQVVRAASGGQIAREVARAFAVREAQHVGRADIGVAGDLTLINARAHEAVGAMVVVFTIDYVANALALVVADQQVASAVDRRVGGEFAASHVDVAPLEEHVRSGQATDVAVEDPDAPTELVVEVLDGRQDVREVRQVVDPELQRQHHFFEILDLLAQDLDLVHPGVEVDELALELHERGPELLDREPEPPHLAAHSAKDPVEDPEHRERGLVVRSRRRARDGSAEEPDDECEAGPRCNDLPRTTSHDRPPPRRLPGRSPGGPSAANLPSIHVGRPHILWRRM